jgi:hypothetical protein
VPPTGETTNSETGDNGNRTSANVPEISVKSTNTAAITVGTTYAWHAHHSINSNRPRRASPAPPRPSLLTHNRHALLSGYKIIFIGAGT